MANNVLKEATPTFYGVTVVSERGQVVIPAEARRDFGLEPTTKLLVFGSKNGEGLLFTKAETVTDFIKNAMTMLTRFEKALGANAKLPTENR